MKRRLKVNGFLIFVALMLIFIFPRVFLRAHAEILAVQVVRVLGVFLILLGQLLRVSSRGFKAEHSGNGRHLIQGGPYSLVRNPMYLGILLIGIGLGLALFKYWALCLFLLIFVIRYIPLLFSEEKKLLGLFGESYAGYCKTVPRLIPGLKSLFEKNIRVCLPIKPAWLYKEIGSIIAVLSLTLLLWYWGARCC